MRDAAGRALARLGLPTGALARMVRWTSSPSDAEAVSVEAVSSAFSGNNATAFSVVLERTLPIATVRLRGPLDANAARDLRAALVSALAHQPTGVLVDASELVIVSDQALAVLASVAAQSSHWPGAPFVVIGPPAVVAAVDRLQADIMTCPDESAALAALRRSPRPPCRRLRIEPNRDAPATARLAVREFCAEQSLGGNGDAAQLVASELVTNAVIHAGTTMELILRYVPPLLHISVGDGSPQVPQINSTVDENAENGRGLLLVDALATAWGSLVPDDGKVVWATVRVYPSAVSADAPR